MKYTFWLLVLLYFSLVACQTNSAKSTNLLAKVYGKNLYLEDLQLDHIQEMSHKDSSELIKKLVDNWIVDEILLKEAKESIGQDKALNQLVEKYKKSLYLFELEKKVLANMDTSISKIELDSLCKHYKNTSNLQDDLVKFLLVKVPTEFDNDTLETLWETENIIGLKTFVHAVDGLAILDIDKWYEKSELKAIIPERLTKKINYSKTESYTLLNDEYKFHLKILAVVNQETEIPDSFLRERIRQRIIHDRSKKYTNDWKIKLYKNNIQSKDIVIYE